MYLYIIRHGAPDYGTDTLLGAGIAQAHAVAKRLAKSGIDEIHSSPMGRARQTAQPLANRLNLPVIIEDWAYELGEESKTSYPDGVPKVISSLSPTHIMQPAYQDLTLAEGLETIPAFTDSQFRQRYDAISSGLDDMLSRLGYRRNSNNLYDEISPNSRHVALFCHAGMTRVMLSHLLHIPYQMLAASFIGHYTGVTIVSLSQKKLKYSMSEPIPTDYPQVAPTLVSYSDTGHLYYEMQDAPAHYLLKDTF